MELRITNATAEDWPTIRAWCAREGWNPGITDGEAFFAQDRNGFFVGRLGDRPVTSVSVVNYGGGFAFLGLYLCEPDERGKGYGLATWKHAVEHAGARTIGLDGVVAQQDNYRRSGFEPAYRNVRYSGPVTPKGDPGRDATIIPVADFTFGELVEYDKQCFPALRPKFLRRWLTAPGTVAFCRVVDGRLTGYGSIRPAEDVPKIGPLFADSAEDAAALLEALVAGFGVAGGTPVHLDVPDVNAVAVALAEGYGLEPVFECARMYTGPIPDVALGRVFGNTSLELG